MVVDIASRGKHELDLINLSRVLDGTDASSKYLLSSSDELAYLWV